MSQEAQAFSVKRAQVEFHNFASFGEPERNLRIYADENTRRGSILRNHLKFVGPLSPFLEIGANAGHTSYMLCNEFGAAGFALDISADSLRHGRVLMDAWNLERAPIRVAGDAVNLPFADGSLRMVATFQTLSQFLDIEKVFAEVHRVLQPGGIFFFAEEPLLRTLSLRLYRCPYYETMKPWEKKLHDWGLLGYFVKDVIGAHQEESFGIRQNHTMGLREWDALVKKYFVAHEYDAFVPERGWGERWMKQFAKKIDRHHSDWLAARLLGGTLAAVCRKSGTPPTSTPPLDKFEVYLQCPDCRYPITRDAEDTLRCGHCNYEAPNEGDVYNLLPAAEKRELYPGDRADIIDFSLPSHAKHLVGDWYDLEGVHGNKFRWIGEQAVVQLTRVKDGTQRLRIRGFASEKAIPGEVQAIVNGTPTGNWKLDRPGLFILETDLPTGAEYTVEIHASPSFTVPEDDRRFTVNLSMIRLIDRN